jgi:hypothetical protein
MKTFNTFQEALAFQEDKTYNVTQELSTGIENIDRIQFSVGEVVWLILADGYYLDDWEESVTQYGITANGEWAAVSGGHCSCYGWEDMSGNDITFYPSLEVMLKADKSADVIIRHKEALKRSYSFLDF